MISSQFDEINFLVSNTINKEKVNDSRRKTRNTK